MLSLLPAKMWTDKITCAISSRTGIKEVRLAHYISLASVIVLFETVLGREHSGKVSKKSIDRFYF